VPAKSALCKIKEPQQSGIEQERERERDRQYGGKKEEEKNKYIYNCVAEHNTQ